MFNKLSLRIEELFVLLKTILAYLYSIFLPPKDIWVISERGKEARDNGWFFFNYLTKEHPDIDARYIIDKHSADLAKFNEQKEHIIYYRSFAHYVMLFRAKYLISTHIMGYTPFRNFFVTLDKKIRLFPQAKRIFLQHGVISNRIEGLFCPNIQVDTFVCGSKTECDYIKQNFGHPNGVVQYTGLCRYDNLQDSTRKNQILFMPTFRMYIDKSHFEGTDYYKNYSALLTSPKLNNLLESYGYELIFYPHYEVQPFLNSFKKLKLANCVKIAGFEYDVQRLLIESKVLITDNSSVFFDIAYMHKPIIFYFFDKERFCTSHYQEGYFKHQDLGDFSKTLDEMLQNLEEALQRNCQMRCEHLEYANKLFTYRDTNNCERVYHAIINC